ncbi:MoaD/ThiS family protein [Pseudomonadota bacterium]
MKLTIRYFAAFRELTGVATETLETSAGTPSAVFSECAQRHSALQKFTSSMVAVNDEMAHWDSTLSDGDEVLFFPPVAGG